MVIEDGTPHFKLLLREYEDILEEEWEQAWVVIGGTPHLYEYSKNDFQHALLEGFWDDKGIQMDFYTMTQLINYFRKIGIDCDDLIDSGNAIYKIEYEKSKLDNIFIPLALAGITIAEMIYMKSMYSLWLFVIYLLNRD